MVLGDEIVGNETCLECHEGMSETLKFTPHRLSSTIDKPNKTINCVSCHSGASTHVDDPSIDNIENPKNLNYIDASALCFSCHQAHTDLDNYGFDAHSTADMNCSSCHKVHTNKRKLLLDSKSSFCLKCHTDVKSDFMRNSNHPIRQGSLTCLSCHKFTKRSNDNIAYDMSRICQDCHPQQAGPFLYEHDAVEFYSLEGGGCVECHEPHGSQADRLLKQTTNSLCSSCHFEPLHMTAHPDRDYENYNCVSCHTDMHGSFVSEKFLDPNLPSRFIDNCYQSGCHQLND
jgi:DmsE family decaheme c-type cytochrome